MMTVVCLYLLYSFKIILVDAHSVKTGVRTAFSQPLGMKNSDLKKKYVRAECPWNVLRKYYEG